jgi:hypothetical protein
MGAANSQVTGLFSGSGAVPGVALASAPERVFTARAGAAGGLHSLPVLPALADLLPGGLPRGSVVATGAWGLLCLAVAAAASGAGAWCAVTGLPRVGVAAAAGAGLDPDRILLVPDPGPGWPQVVASLLDGCELVLLRPPTLPSASLRRRLESVARRHGGVLVIAGEWDGAQHRLTVTSQEWAGIGAGHGRLRARRAQVVAHGRGAAARAQARWLWLPGPDGSVTPVTSTAAEPAPIIAVPSGPGVTATRPGAVVAGPDAAMGEPEADRWRARTAG